MIPEFNVKKIDARLSSDKVAHLVLYVILFSIIAFYVLVKVIHGQFHPVDLIGFGVVTILVALQSITRFLPVTKDWAMFNSGGVGALLIYNLAIYTFMILYLPFYSPFLLMFPTLMFITIYYRGLKAFFISIIGLAIVVIVATALHGIPNVDGSKYFPYLTIILGAAFGGIIARAGAIDEAFRKEFLRVSKGIETEREQLSSLINSIPAAVVAIDKQDHILFYNDSAKHLLHEEKVDDQKQLKLIPLYNSENTLINIFDMAVKKHGQKIHLVDVHVFSKDKQKIDLGIDISSIHGRTAQEELGYIIILRDITKDKNLEQERNEFIAVTSHELRTPLATAEASLSLLLNPEITKNVDKILRDRLEIAYDSIIYLADLTNQLSILSFAETEDLETNLEIIDPANLMETIRDNYQKQVEKKGLKLNLNINPGVMPIRTSKAYVTEILQNFITNAIKYTHEGSIGLEVALADEDIVFSVKDTGVGIPEDDKQQIFGKYYRAGDYRTRETNGTGLGLYLSKKLVKYIDGKIWFSSQQNRGSIFYLQVPNIKKG